MPDSEVGRRDVVSDILGRLEEFIADGQALPATNDGKVNVLELCRLLGLSVNDAQHLHRKPEIKAAVNALAAEAGLLGVGERGKASDPGVEDIEKRIARANDKARDADQASVEKTAANELLVVDLRAAHARIVELEALNRALEARLRLVEEYGVLFDAGRWSGS